MEKIAHARDEFVKTSQVFMIADISNMIKSQQKLGGQAVIKHWHNGS